MKLELQKDLAKHLRGGHPWVYGRAIERGPSSLQAGDVVDVTEKGKFVARGYYDSRQSCAVLHAIRDSMTRAIEPARVAYRGAACIKGRCRHPCGTAASCRELRRDRPDPSNPAMPPTREGNEPWQ